MKKMISRLSALLLAFISGMTAMFIPVSASGYGIKADSRTTNTIRLLWEDQDKADAYRVYKYDASKKKFKEYKTVVANQCTITDLKPGTGYKFKVRALRKNKKGKFAKLSESGVVTVKTLSKSGSSGKSGSDSSKKKPSRFCIVLCHTFKKRLYAVLVMCSVKEDIFAYLFHTTGPIHT